jgi:hypothetical protein
MVRGNSSGGIDSSGQSSVPEVCFLPIPLTTIVATFLIDLVLPVVTLMFGLFWMLRLRFCVPPEINVPAGLSAELALDAVLDPALEASIKGNVSAAFGAGSELTGALQSGFSAVALGNLAFGAKVAGDSLSLSNGLEFEPEVKFS